MDTRDDAMRDEYIKKNGLTVEQYIEQEYGTQTPETVLSLQRYEQQITALFEQSRLFEEEIALMTKRIKLVEEQCKKLRLDRARLHVMRLRADANKMTESAGRVTMKLSLAQDDALSAITNLREKQQAEQLKKITDDFAAEMRQDRDKTQAGTPTWDVPDDCDAGTYLGPRWDEEGDDLYDWYFNPTTQIYSVFYGHNESNGFRHLDHEETPQTFAAEMALWARNRAKELGLVPTFKHKCPKCVFLGTWEPETEPQRQDYAKHYDLYYCLKYVQVAAKYGDGVYDQGVNDPHEYDDHPAITRAQELARKKGLIS